MSSAFRSQACASALLVLLLMLAPMACRDSSTPTPPPLPTPKPTATPSAERVLEGALFTLSLDDTLLATEEIRTRVAEDQLIVFSEIRWLGQPIIERRTVLLSRVLNPLRYDLEQVAYRVRSIWVAERDADRVSVLNSNQNWYAPVLVERIAPAADVYLESAPSALPYALLALRYTDEGREEDDALGLHCLDVMEDYPVSRSLTLGPARERESAVIGTEALGGAIPGGRNPRFTMWIRPQSRALYGVEIEGYQPGLWQQARYLAPAGSGTLLISRVASFPEEVPVATPTGDLRQEALDFAGADKTLRRGTLTLPPGQGPFPCLVVHSPGGVTPRWSAVQSLVARGWATYSYDRRGLGESEGEFESGQVSALGADAVAAAQRLAEHPLINPGSIVFLGLGEGGQAGALAVASSDAFAAAVLASCAATGSLFPTLAEHRICHVLAPFYGWDGEALETYRQVSVQRWSQWLFEGQQEIGALGRRVSLRGLRDQANTDLYAALSQTETPVLLLHGQADPWTPVEGARVLQQRLSQVGAPVELSVFEGLGRDLGGDGRERAFAPAVEEAIFSWLQGVISP